MRTRAAVCALVMLNVAAMAVSLVLTESSRRPIVEDQVGPVGIDDLSGLAWVLTGAALVWLRPHHALGWLFLVLGSAGTFSLTLSLYGSFGLLGPTPWWPLAREAAWIGSVLWLPALLPMANLLPALYPDGRLPRGRLWWLAATALCGVALVTLAALLDPTFDDDVAPGAPTIVAAPALAPVLLVVAGVLLIPSTLAIWVMSVRRLVRSRPPERAQLAWLLFVIVPMFVLGLVPGLPEWWWQTELYLIPVAIAVGVLRHNLLGIELLLRRGLVYGALTATVVSAYLAVTVAVGTRVSAESLPALVAAGLVAVALAPLRERLQQAVDRFLYGERHDPLRALTRLGDQVAADEPDLLASVLEVVTSAVRAPGGVVWTVEGEPAAAVGRPGPGWDLELRVGGSAVGRLTVAARSPGESYGPADRRLLLPLAQQVAVVMRALDLASALEAERDRVVSATRDERDRLRRDLHDGLGPSLAGVRLGLAALDDMSTRPDGAGATELLDRIRTEVDGTVVEVRRILDGLGPEVLDREGLAEAVRRYVRSLSSAVRIDLALGGLGPLPSTVEATAYRIVQEALTNVVRHAGATDVEVTLQVLDDELAIRVVDNGSGMGVVVPGLGVASMRRRAESLGGRLALVSSPGGTAVTAALPVGRSTP